MKHDKKKFKTVEEYFSLLAPDEKIILNKLRKTIKKLIPNSTEVISYNMPGFKFNGKIVLFIAAFKDHFSLFPGGIVKVFEKDLKNFKHAKGTIQFTKDNLLPNTLIKKIVLYRLNQIKVKNEIHKRS